MESRSAYSCPYVVFTFGNHLSMSYPFSVRYCSPASRRFPHETVMSTTTIPAFFFSRSICSTSNVSSDFVRWKWISECAHERQKTLIESLLEPIQQIIRTFYVVRDSRRNCCKYRPQILVVAPPGITVRIGF